MSQNLNDLDIEQPEALLAYLRHAGLISAHERPTFSVLAGGVSNRTVLVERPFDSVDPNAAQGRPSGEAWVIKQALAKLRVQVDWFSSPERVHREALGLRWLSELAPPGSLPGFVHEDHDHHLLIMQAVPQPHANWKQMLLAGDVQPGHIEQFGRMLGLIHAHAFARRDELAAVFADASFFESLRLEPYYAYTASQVPEAAAFLHELIAETRRQRLTLVHGDYSPKNILVHHGRLILLDHEVIHWGDPAFDLGFSLTHLLSKAHHLPAHRPVFIAAARQYWMAYRSALDDLVWPDLEPRVIRHTLACLLARVSGRSPLEYLDSTERARQRVAVLALLPSPPPTAPALITRFCELLD